MDTPVLVHPFPPLYDADSEVLILGSFPSVVSREQSFYYANPSNRFWRVLEGVFEEKITDRTSFCLKHHIALWDVIESCTIEGSSDSRIRNVRVNDFTGLLAETKIRHIFTTGALASRLFIRHTALETAFTPLPSTSAANARMREADLVKAYMIIREVLNHEES